MDYIRENIEAVRERIALAAQRSGRRADEVTLIAVTKNFDISCEMCIRDRSVVEYIEKRIKAKTLFATHYHELTELEKRYEDVENFCVAVKKRGEEITFLRKIIRGGADESYGVEVAALAGIPKEVVTRARQILKNLEENDANRPQNVSGKRNVAEKELPPMEALAREALLEEIKMTEVLVLSPLEAQAKLNDLVNRARNL